MPCILLFTIFKCGRLRSRKTHGVTGRLEVISGAECDIGTVVQSGYDPPPVSTLLERVHQPARRRLALTVSYRMVDLRQPPPPLVSRPEMSKHDLPAAISKLLNTTTKLRPREEPTRGQHNSMIYSRPTASRTMFMFLVQSTLRFTPCTPTRVKLRTRTRPR